MPYPMSNNSFGFGSDIGFLNPFIMAMSQPPLATGLPMGAGIGGGGNFDISGLVGVTDPMMSLTLNTIIGGLLTKTLGNNFIPAQFSPTTNLYSQMSARQKFGDFKEFKSKMAAKDAPALYEYMRGVARITGSEFGPREQEAARSFAASAATNFLPNIPAEIIEAAGIGGAAGSATTMAQNMFLGARYATDPVTGRRGFSSQSSAEVAGKIFENLYGKGKDIKEMGGVTAGQAGALYDELQRRGLMGSAGPRADSLEKIAKDTNMTIAEVSAMPELDTKIRELDADRISERLKSMSKAVSAIKEVFGEMGQPNAPMQQLVGAIEALTQANIPSTEPARLERMIRDTSNTAKAAGIEMPQMFRLMGSTAAMTDRAGLDRVFAPDITNRAVMENEASKRMFGGAKAFGLSSFDKLMNVSQQLGVEATNDPRTQQLGAIVRLVDQYKFKPKEGSELAKAYDILTGKRQSTEEERRNLISISQRPGGFAEFLKGQKVGTSDIQSLLANPSANAEFMHKYDIGTKFGRDMQFERITRGMAAFGGAVVQRYGRDETTGANEKLRTELDQNYRDISYVAAEALLSASDEEKINKPEEVVRKAVESHLKSKGVVISSDKDKQLINSLSAGFSDTAKSFAVRSNFGSLPNLQVTMNRNMLREADINQAEVSQESQFQEVLRGIGKTNVTQRIADLIKNAGPNTTLSEGVAAIMGLQDKGVVANLLGPEIDKLDKASKLFVNFDAQKIKDEYFRNAAIETSIKLSDEKLPEPERQKLLKQKQVIMGQMEKAGYGKVNGIEKEFEQFADFTKNPEFKGIKTPEEALKSAEGRLRSFEDRYGISIEDLNKYDIKNANIIGRGAQLKRMQEAAQSSSLTILDRFGNAIPGNTPFTELNAAFNDLNSTNLKDKNFGLDSMASFIDAYIKSPDLLAKGGNAGLDIAGKAIETKQAIDKLSSGLGTSLEDLLKGNVKGPAITLEQLTEFRERDANFLETVMNKDQAPVAREVINKEISALEETINKGKYKDENDKTVKEMRVKRLKELRDTRDEDIESQKIKADKALEDIKNSPAEAVKKEFESFKSAKEKNEKSDRALTDLIKNIENTQKMSIDRYTLDKLLTVDRTDAENTELMGLGSDAAVVSAASADRKKQILKSSNAANVSEYAKAHSMQLSGQERINRISNLISEESSRSLNEVEKKEKNEFFKQLGITSDKEFEKLKDVRITDKESKELLGLNRANLTPEEEKRKKELLDKGRYKDIQEVERYEGLRTLNDKKLGDRKGELIAALEQQKTDQKDAIEKAKAINKFDPEALKAILNKGDIKSITETLVNQASKYVTDLGKQLANQEGSEVSEDRKKDIRRMVRMSADVQDRNLYLGSIGLTGLADKAVKDNKVSPNAIGAIAGKLSYAAAEAARASKYDKNATEIQKIEALRDILYKSDDQLTPEQLKVKGLAERSDIDKKMFKQDGKGANVFSTSDVDRIFKETNKKLTEGDLLDSKNKGIQKVTFPDNYRVVVDGRINLEGEAHLGLRGGSSPNMTTT